jgi:hypothetical protein
MSELILQDRIDSLESFRRDASWYRAHYVNLKKKYGGKYIAIANRRVVRSDADQDRLLIKLKQKRFKNKTYVIKYISNREAYPAP